MLLADLLETFAPRGWFPPVAPGTRLVTVGGMIAADVHGKNHHRDGTFGAHADGAIRECSREENADLFRATLGGMGLTGVILSARFRLRPGSPPFLECAAASGQGSFLGVLKLFGPAGEGLMSFPMEGYTLALDFPVRSGMAALLDGLDEITHRHGGRVYLAKDARCAPERVREGYPRLGAFEAVRAEAAGAPPRFASELSRRLAL